jgi:excinuclease UvrABC nuclease subunit
MTVWRPDGTVGTTRTAPVQLADKTVAQLNILLAQLERDMVAAAARTDFEEAAHLRDEAEAVRRTLESRG